ncbi:MAG: hypothetical protein JWN46_1189 [Acidimicrobiales bacterium]|nr:hypothetical protein [Acidimicrobiales bacterium]
MTEISDRYRRRAQAFQARVDAVPEDRWESPSPCDEWTARGVVSHVVATHGMFLGFVDRDLGPIPPVDADPSAAFASVSAVVLADLEDPERAAAGFEGFSGPTTFESSVDRFLSFDLIIHGWDLARATGQDDRIDPVDIDGALEAAQAFGPAMRNPRAFGPEVEPPADADDQARLLAFLGRQP